jgi:hypothetical protein
MLDAQIDTDWDDPGDAGMLKIAYRPMAFFEERKCSCGLSVRFLQR